MNQPINLDRPLDMSQMMAPVDFADRAAADTAHLERIAAASQNDAPIHQRLWNQIERGSAYIDRAYATTPRTMLFTGIALGAIGEVALFEHIDQRHPVEIFMGGMIGGVVGSIIAVTIDKLAPAALREFVAARMGSETRGNNENQPLVRA